jgi:hypothetical protein
MNLFEKIGLKIKNKKNCVTFHEVNKFNYSQNEYNLNVKNLLLSTLQTATLYIFQHIALANHTDIIIWQYSLKVY